MKKLILILFTAIFFTNAQAQCNADFSYMQNGPTTVFTDLSNINSNYSAGVGNLTKFVSTNSRQDSLSFESRTAFYSLKDFIINTKDGYSL